MNPTTIVCTTPAHAAGTVDVVIVVNGLQVTGSNAFTYQAITISSLGTTNGPAGGGTSVVITGTGFVNGNLAGTSVTFGGTTAVVSAVTSTSITCTTPARATGVVDVVVTSNGQSVTSVGAFTYLPGLTSLDVTSGTASGGTSVTITGSGFVNGATVVSFGGSNAAITSVNPTTIVCTTPAHAAGSVDVTVSVNGLPVTGTNAFTYLPSLSSLDVVSGPVTGGTTVTISGIGFASGATVQFGSGSAAVTVVTPTSITCTTPAQPAGMVAVTVTCNGQSATLAGAFTFQSITISSLDTTSGSTAGGTSVIVSGTGFAAGDIAGTSVVFDGLAAVVSAVTSTTITCTTPAHAAAVVDVVVTSNGQSTTLSAGFVYLPIISAVDVVTGTVAGGSTIRISGSGFQNPLLVTFGGTVANVTTVTATSIDCITPAHSAGLVDVVVTVNGLPVLRANAFTFYSLAVQVAPVAIEAGSLGNPITGLITTSRDPSLVPLATDLVYQVEVEVAQGELTRHRVGDPVGGLPLVQGAVFTQNDLNLGLVRYSHTGAASAKRDDFAFSVSYRGSASDPNEPRSSAQFLQIDILRTLPVVALTGSTPPVYRVQDGSPVRLADLGSVILSTQSNGGILVRSDQDGLLVFAVTTGAESQDVLGLAPQGLVTLTGPSLFYDGNLIGTVAGGTGGSALSVQFLHPAIPVTAEVASAVLRTLVYSSDSKRPGLTQRRIAITATNGLGDASSAVFQVLDLVPFNLAPTIANASLVAMPGIPVPGQIQVQDGDDATHTFQVSAPPSKGRVALDPATGAFTYTADQGSAGADSFTVTASDLGIPGAPVSTDTQPKSGTGTITLAISGSENVGLGQTPVITSNPPMEVAAGGTLLYAPVLAAANPSFQYSVIWVTHPADENAVANRFKTDHVINWPNVPDDLSYQVFWIVITDPVSNTATSQRVLIKVQGAGLAPSSSLPRGNG